ncbi:uncharacterized protein PAC_16571 [Phialocephala subalpina]|uniref:BZIP domain-containing protein n=1 Tax=Phialocephala subalpina TaxID=576137 RepID=A0A1L7XNN0_9HELO|nr:uncharacterized protein PAC_16571 [Phialocephala subalpina]
MEVVERLRIVVEPMTQRSEVRDKEEDWTGKNSTALRRKLQNRLNKRASRRRKNEALAAAVRREEYEDPIQKPAEQEFQRVSCLPLPTTVHFDIARRPYGHLPTICLQTNLRKRLTAAPSFADFLRFPLPVDQKLLTLLHFNLVRALTQNVHMLGLDPDRMNDDIESPWVDEKSGLKSELLPETMRPTRLQREVSHHPECDMLPFREYRDNLVLGFARKEIDDVELCMDVLYGVDPSESERVNKCVSGVGEVTGRTGLIVWSDPWLQESWEVEEGFARKWRRLVENCLPLIESTNYWRRSRGERPLMLDG